MSLFRLLHLSDTHIGKTYKPSADIAYTVVSDIKQENLYPINAVIVTGDIFDGQVTYSQDQLNEAVSFFNLLLAEINNYQVENKISKEDFIFVPGNHDIIRTEDIHEQWKKYNDFLKLFYGDIPSDYNLKTFSVCKIIKSKKIALIGFNSCKLEMTNHFDTKYIEDFKCNISRNLNPEDETTIASVLQIMQKQKLNKFIDTGYIPMEQMAEANKKVKNFDDYNIIAFFHHHFYLFPEISQKFGDTSLVKNYTAVLDQLKYMNVKTILHGHKHYDLERPYITEDYYTTADSIIDVFGGGSLGSNRTEKHTFSIIDIYEKPSDDKLTHRKICYHGEQKESIRTKKIPPKNLSMHSINLEELLNHSNPDIYKPYKRMSEKIYKITPDCKQIISWISKALGSFDTTIKQLNSNYINILFVLYAVNCRTLNYLNIANNSENSSDTQKYVESSNSFLKDFYQLHMRSQHSLDFDKFHNLFSIGDLEALTKVCDKLLDENCNKANKEYLAFAMLGIFFTDLYLILTKYADYFFKENIEHKVNVKIEENRFHENVPSLGIAIKSDIDRRSVTVTLCCHEATAHKMAVLFVKEFDLLINKFEEYFRIIGLKLYYLLPKIEKDDITNTLDNYNFEAYIPTLLPLLTGNNIYPSKLVFARELIQNSIDAIAVREAKDNKQFNNTIRITLGIDDKEQKYFSIADEGTGMDRYKIERYFTSIGRSFYSGDEFEELKIDYKPISNFGIGFLSSFMVCKEIDVKTKYYEDRSEGLKISIPNYDGCFFIEEETSLEVGTELKLYLDSKLCNHSNEEIINYIKRNMLDIKYDIQIIESDIQKGSNSINIPAHQLRKQKENSDIMFFIPLTDGGSVMEIDYSDVALTDNYLEKYEYGIYILSEYSNKERSLFILNSGILVDKANLYSLFYPNTEKENYGRMWKSNAKLCLNFPANWLQLDVSREKIASFMPQINDTIRLEIANALLKQLTAFLKSIRVNHQEVSVSYFNHIVSFGLFLCRKESHAEVHLNLKKLKYGMTIEINQNSIKYVITQSQEKQLIITNNRLENSSSAMKNIINRIHNLESTLNTSANITYRYSIFRQLEDAFYHNEENISIKNHVRNYAKKFFKVQATTAKEEQGNILSLLAALILYTRDELTNNKRRKTHPYLEMTSSIAMHFVNVSEFEQEKFTLELSYEDIYKSLDSNKELPN